MRVPSWLTASLSPSQPKATLQDMWRECFGVVAYMPTTKVGLIEGLRVAREQHWALGRGRTGRRAADCGAGCSIISAAEVNGWLQGLPRLDPDEVTW